MKVTGKTRIFKNEYGFSTTLGNKLEDGTYDNMFINVKFKSTLKEPANSTEIEILDGFLTFNTSKKDSKKYVNIVIMDYKEIV